MLDFARVPLSSVSHALAAALLLVAAGLPAFAGDRPSERGLFEAQTDIGAAVPPGGAQYDASKERYQLTSAGANTWYHVDAFHYLWKKASGDMALTAEISFPDTATRTSPIRTVKES